MNWKSREALRLLELGGVIAYPTETVYGLGCDPFNAAAVMQLLALKHRNIRHGLVLIGADFSQFEPLLLPLPSATRARVNKARAAAVTWVLPCLPAVPVWLRGEHSGLAVRVSSHPLAATLCREWGGPLVSTSANRHGRHPATTALAVRRAFDDELDCILHGACGSGRPSEIRDGISGKILRGG